MIVHFSMRLHPGGLCDSACFCVSVGGGRGKGEDSKISEPTPPKYDGRVSRNKSLFVHNASVNYFTPYHRYY